MKDKIKRERQLLKAFLLLLFLSSSVFLCMGLDEMPVKYAGKFFFRAFFSIIALLLILTSVYLYKICKQYYPSSVIPWLISIVFIACFFSQFSLVSFLIGVVMIWKSRRLLEDR